MMSTTQRESTVKYASVTSSRSFDRTFESELEASLAWRDAITLSR